MVIVVLVALNQSQLEHGLARSQHFGGRTVSTWAATSRSLAPAVSTRVVTTTHPSRLSGCPFSSGGTHVADSEAQMEAGSVESDVFARERKSEGDVDRDEKAAKMETISLPRLSLGR